MLDRNILMKYYFQNRGCDSNRIILCLYRRVGDQRNWENLLPLSTISLWGNQVANQAINKKEILEIFPNLFVKVKRREVIFN